MKKKEPHLSLLPAEETLQWTGPPSAVETGIRGWRTDVLVLWRRLHVVGIRKDKRALIPFYNLKQCEAAKCEMYLQDLFFFFCSRNLNSETDEAVSNGGGERCWLVFLIKLPWRAASRRWAVALGGFIHCRRVNAWGLCSYVSAAIHLPTCTFIMTVGDGIKIPVVLPALQLQREKKNTQSYYLKFPYTNETKLLQV